MEPLLAIIVAVAGAFGTETLDGAARRRVTDLWEQAKNIIAAKFDTPIVPRLMDELRRRPTMSTAEHVAAQLTALNVTNDAEVARLFREMAAKIHEESDRAFPAVSLPQRKKTWLADRRA